MSRVVVVAHAARSGIAALNVVTAALDSDPRTRDVEVRFAKTRAELAAAIAPSNPRDHVSTAADRINRQDAKTPRSDPEAWSPIEAMPPIPAWRTWRLGGESDVPRVIVAHSFYSTDFARVVEDLTWLRANAAPALHVAGGVHATAEPETTIRAGFDLVIAGEGEAAFVELVSAVAEGRDPRGGPGTVWDGGRTIERGPAAPRRPLDDFPAANLRHGRWNPVEITRGCIYACSFCQTPFMFKARFRHRSVGNVRDHVRAMVAGGLRYVRYVSPTSLSYGSADASVNLAAVEELLAAVRAELPAGGKQYFGTFPSEVRPEHVSAEALALIRRHADNTSLVIGGQSGSERLLAATHRGHDVAAIERAVAICAEHGFRADVDFLFGLPGETPDDRAATIALAERITTRGARVHSHAFMPLPGTPLAAATPTPIASDLADSVARLESRGAAYGQWREQARVASELVALRRRR